MQFSPLLFPFYSTPRHCRPWLLSVLAAPYTGSSRTLCTMQSIPCRAMSCKSLFPRPCCVHGLTRVVGLSAQKKNMYQAQIGGTCICKLPLAGVRLSLRMSQRNTIKKTEGQLLCWLWRYGRRVVERQSGSAEVVSCTAQLMSNFSRIASYRAMITWSVGI